MGYLLAFLLGAFVMDVYYDWEDRHLNKGQQQQTPSN